MFIYENKIKKKSYLQLFGLASLWKGNKISGSGTYSIKNILNAKKKKKEKKKIKINDCNTWQL